MEQFLAPFANLGIGGLMAGAVLWAMYHIVVKVIPQLLAAREADLAWARSLVDRQQTEFLSALRRICEQLETIEERISKGS